MTEEEFKEEVRSFADLCLIDYPKSFEITFSMNDAGMGTETHSADILITMDNGSTWNIPIIEDESGDPVIESGDDYSLPLNAESSYAILWFEAMDRQEESDKFLDDAKAAFKAKTDALEAERAESLERIWTRLGNTPDPRNPGWFVCNSIEFDQWEALRRSLFNEPQDQ